MFNLNQQINKLKIYSFFLFIIPMIGILGTLTVSNILSNFPIAEPRYPYSDSKIQSFTCNANNQYCEKIVDRSDKNLDRCSRYLYIQKITQNNDSTFILTEFKKKFIKNGFLLDEFKNDKLKLTFEKTNNLDKSCINNNKVYYFLYKKIPSVINLIQNIRKHKKYSSATSRGVYPFLYGETSISNIVKRYPINYLFKPIMFLASILMFLYWKTNNLILNSILNQNEKNKFYIFGVLSAVFFFFHVLLLGIDYDKSYFKTLRRLIIIFFILFEVLAQYKLVRKIYEYKSNLLSFIKLRIFKIKIILVSFVLIFTVMIVSILGVFDLTKQFDYFLEWNYFIILLFFYLLSSLMWIKNKS